MFLTSFLCIIYCCKNVRENTIPPIQNFVLSYFLIHHKMFQANFPIFKAVLQFFIVHYISF